MDRPRHSYHVEWYINGPILMQNVTVHIGGGRLIGTEPGCSPDAIRLGNVAFIPGLVNAHTHLEFSLIPEPLPMTGRFTDWIRSVVKYRREHADLVPRAIHQGVAESIASGTTLIGDIATTGWAIEDYNSTLFSGVVFQELLGLGHDRVATQSDLAASIAARPWSANFEAQSPEARKAFGLSPHAPYSVHPDLLQRTIVAASNHDCPVAMHLAETPAELQLLAQATGDFRDLLADFGIWQEGLFGGKTPGDVLAQLAKSPRALVIHGNYLDEAELQFLASQPQMTLVYCPRTHAAFGHREHPWRRLLELQGRVAIGTDSRASNPDLSLFAELQFLATQNPDFSHLQLLKLGTDAGRAALLGDVDQNDRADFCVVHWESPLSPDPDRNLFALGNRVVGTMTAGEWSFVAEGFAAAVPKCQN